LVALLPHKNTWVNVTAIEVPTAGTGNPCKCKYGTLVYNNEHFAFFCNISEISITRKNIANLIYLVSLFNHASLKIKLNYQPDAYRDIFALTDN